MSSKYELQNLLRKMGGTPNSGDNVDETIKKITEVYDPSGGGSGVPEGGTIGQILRKNSSEDGDADWDSDTYVITITYASSRFTSDKKYLEIRQKISQGVPVIVRSDYLQTPNDYVYYQLDNAINVYIDFVRTDYYGENGAKIYRQRFRLQRDNDSEYPYVSYFSGYVAQPLDNRLIPSGGSSNQVLMKNSGVYYDVKWGSPIASNGVPSGGTQGQVLAKNSGTNYDASWQTPHYIPTGGIQGQVLKKNSSANYDVSWARESGDSTVLFEVFESNGNWFIEQGPGLSQAQHDFLARVTDPYPLAYSVNWDTDPESNSFRWVKSWDANEYDEYREQNVDVAYHLFASTYIEDNKLVTEIIKIRFLYDYETIEVGGTQDKIIHEKATVAATITT